MYIEVSCKLPINLLKFYTSVCESMEESHNCQQESFFDV